MHLINDKPLAQALFVTLLGVTLAAPAVAMDVGPPAKSRAWELHGLPTQGDVHLNISGISLSEDRSLMVVGSDEGAHIQVLRQDGKHRYKLIDEGHFALAYEETELDIEGVAGRGSEIWIIGSHAMKRKLMKTKKEIKKLAKKREKDGRTLDADYNHKRLSTVAVEPTREWLYRVRLDADGKVLPESVVRGSLRDILANHSVLARFRNIPSKENGIDIEGLALMPVGEDAQKTRLLVGFRGPTLRGPVAVVLVIEAKEKSADDGSRVLKIKLLDTRYLALGGHGVRGISEIPGKHGGYLVLAGPVGDEPTPYALHYWNGKDTVAEADALDASDNIAQICSIPSPGDAPTAKAEGVQFLDEKGGRIHFLIVYDTGPNGSATAFTCGFDRS